MKAGVQMLAVTMEKDSHSHSCGHCQHLHRAAQSYSQQQMPLSVQNPSPNFTDFYTFHLMINMK